MIGVFPLTPGLDCDQLDDLQINLSVVEIDNVANDHFNVSPLFFDTGALPCDTMRADFQAGGRGEYELPPSASPTINIVQDGEVVGSISVRTKLLLRGL